MTTAASYTSGKVRVHKHEHSGANTLTPSQASHVFPLETITAADILKNPEWSLERNVGGILTVVLFSAFPRV